MEVTTTFASDIAEIKERLHALDGKGEVEEDTEEHHETTPVTQPVATEEKHEEVKFRLTENRLVHFLARLILGIIIIGLPILMFTILTFNQLPPTFAV